MQNQLIQDKTVILQCDNSNGNVLDKKTTTANNQILHFEAVYCFILKYVTHKIFKHIIIIIIHSIYRAVFKIPKNASYDKLDLKKRNLKQNTRTNSWKELCMLDQTVMNE